VTGLLIRRDVNRRHAAANALILAGGK